MFNLGTSIRIVGHVLIAVCIEDLPDWWRLLYATSLSMPVHEISSLVTWFQYMLEISSYYGDHDPLYIFIMDIMIYVYCTWQWPLMWYYVSCLFIAIVLLCILDCYMYLQLCAELYHCTMLIGWLVFHLGSFITPLIMYFGHWMITLTSHIRGHLL